MVVRLLLLFIEWLSFVSDFIRHGLIAHNFKEGSVIYILVLCRLPSLVEL